MTQNENLKTAQKGAYLSLIVYIVLSIAKFIVGSMYDSAAVRADSLNNMTDIVVSLAVIIGLKISIKPADKNHPYGHLKSENISTLLVSFIIMFVGIQVVIESVPEIFSKDHHAPNVITIYVSVISGIIMLIVFYINQKLAKRTNSSSLNSAAKDNLSDALVSIGTAVGLIFTQFGLPILDTVLATILGLLIIYTGFRIFKESIFTLSDGFNEQELEAYKNYVLEIEDVIDVQNIKGRYHGSSIFVDVTIVVESDLSLEDAHHICDKVEQHMHEKGISSVYVHPEPASIQ
ncbi:MAG: cation diffusion facilitator family transporter [Staphylococcus equorum]|uniref:Cation diffusion facilitator family transporter n=1 Tax=Staphylococcus equorum TaxID=246432 RepID=A0AAW7AR54_9STAP|nr:cation diffusion facilitator family transporter [Staphylococcus equorum]MDG0822936.1 cation diffusion facilitator family transporter [Staphylococcus equorum]MDG0836564.1 cation diffusion facilitator family transporter [Staphylococcus equorum]MDK9866849.1 cation diffusion facilitator family transporter [Staphylococcus equorum]MDK9872446.1 cation diffusion facilitator family transporter [Staphylococcus equorum]MDK9878410.1 cation diffusion facilitator family transporter [Staphylococcus equoru